MSSSQMSLEEKEGSPEEASLPEPAPAEPRESRPTLLSIVTPVYNERENLPILYEELKKACAQVPDLDWEWVLVDDHSHDGSFALFSNWAIDNPNLRGVRFSKNHGSHRALACGLRLAQGDCAVVLAADLQDPPSTIPTLVEKWREGAQIVWAVREERVDQGIIDGWLSRLYYMAMRKFAGLEQLPATGADFFLADHRVVRTLCQFHERNSSVFAILCSIGFRQTEIRYTKQARLHGKSGWTLGKKIKLFVDSIISFTFLPIRYMLSLGLVTGLLGFLYALIITWNYMIGNRVQGWSSIMVITLLLGGVQMIMLGVLGEYLWRALEETRSRPLFLIEDSTGPFAGPSNADVNFEKLMD